jgi:hypothetical protein
MCRRQINQITVLLLLIGFGGAIVIYRAALAAPVDPPVDELMATKKSLREMQLIGGNAEVVVHEIKEWFLGLWHGTRLAGTVAVLTVGVTLVFRFVAINPDLFTVGPEDGEPPPA